jgi:dTDP-4-amino-4,6-dideoxygalactose transaminase
MIRADLAQDAFWADDSPLGPPEDLPGHADNSHVSENGGKSKARWEDLAFFGGKPAFADPLHVGRPNLPSRAAFEAAVDEIWDSRCLTNNGPKVQQLEARFCEWTGARHAVAVSNATLGLQLVARALELEGEVIMPAFTFIATAHAFQWEGLRPVFCDVDPETHTLDPRRIPLHLTEETIAIAGVHLWGNDCGTRELAELAEANGLNLIFDAAHSLGCPPPRHLGDAQVYSLHATKLVNGFEGGVVATNSDLLAHRLRGMRNFGFADYDDVRMLGINAKMSEVAAAMALCGMDQLAEVVESNRRNAGAYEAAFEGLPGIRLVAPADKASTRQYLVCQVHEAEFGVSRDALMAVLWAEGVRARRYFFPGCHWSEPYRWDSPDAPQLLPVTERLCREVLVFPTGPSVDDAAIEAIGAIVRTAQAASRRIAESDLVQAA